MLRGALAFFIIGLLALVLGANNVAGLSIEIGKTLLFVFLALAVISAIIGLVSRRGPRGTTMNAFIPFIAFGLALTGVMGMHVSVADETTGEKVENKVDEASKGTDKTVRKGKRSVRNATGHKSHTEDAKDSMKDAGDDVSHSAKKLKNKVD